MSDRVGDAVTVALAVMVVDHMAWTAWGFECGWPMMVGVAALGLGKWRDLGRRT